MNILFLGDVVGKVGRKALLSELKKIKSTYSIDFTIVNCENITHGKGINKNHYLFVKSIGVDAITLGNHYHNKIEIDNFINTADILIRPLNLENYNLGLGSRVFKVNGKKISVTNLLCKTFMPEIGITSPKDSLENLINSDEEDVDLHIVDLHGEATGEKLSLAYYFDGKVSAFLGTHTHVQTNDFKILENGTAFISDVGMCGAYHSILGVDPNSVIKKTLLNEKSVFKINKKDSYIINGIVLHVDDETNKITSGELINLIEDEKRD